MIRVLRFIAALFVAFCNYGILQAYGSFYTATLETFGESRAKTSCIHSVLLGTGFGTGIVAGFIIKKWNLVVVSTVGSILIPVGFILSYVATSVVYLIVYVGIVVGIGISFTYVCAVTVMGTETSDKHKTTVLSLQNVACGLPGIVLPYFFSWLTRNFDLSGTFLIYGGFTLNNLAATILFSGVKLQSHEENETENENKSKKHINNGRKSQTDDDIINATDEKTVEVFDRIYDHDEMDSATVCADIERNGDTDSLRLSRSGRRFIFILFAIAEPLLIGNISGFQTVYQDVGEFKGLSTDETQFCIAVFNICSTVSRFFPLIFQIMTQNPFVTPILACLFGAAGQILLRVTSQYSWLVAGYGLTGISDGGISTSVSVVIFKILSRESQVLGFGLVLTLMGILATGNGPLYGAIFDATQSYYIVLYLTTSIFTLGLILFLVCFASYQSCTSCCQKKREQQRRTFTDTENKGYEMHQI